MHYKPLTIPKFESVLAPLIQAFLKEKIACGFRYVAECSDLRRFDRFILERGLKEEELPQALVEEWVCKRKDEAIGTHRRRARVTQQFAMFMYWRGHKVFVLNADLSPREQRSFTPYIFTHEEIRRLFVAADNLPSTPLSRLRPIVMPEIFRLLYGCGLRLTEPLRLTVADVDLEQGVLTVRDTKFRKDRLVPVAPELTARLRHLQERLGRRTGKAPFFPARDKGFYGKSAVYDTFRLLLWESGIPHRGRGKGPRVHDLRHTFAVHRMANWYQEKADLNVKLPILSTYMGHKNLALTQRYLHLTLELFADLSVRLDNTFGNTIPRRTEP